MHWSSHYNSRNKIHIQLRTYHQSSYDHIPSLRVTLCMFPLPFPRLPSPAKRTDGRLTHRSQCQDIELITICVYGPPFHPFPSCPALNVLWSPPNWQSNNNSYYVYAMALVCLSLWGPQWPIPSPVIVPTHKHISRAACLCCRMDGDGRRTTDSECRIA